MKRVYYCVRFNRFLESRLHDDICTQSLFINGQENNNGTLGYQQCVGQRYGFLCVLKMAKQMKREKEYSNPCFIWL